MTRAPLNYTERRAFAPQQGIDVTEPVAGWYRIRLGRDTVARAVRLYHGPPKDPVTGEIMDRSWRWQAELDDGDPVEFEDIWPRCAGDPITEDEFETYCARHRWARENAPRSAYANRGRKLNALDPNELLPF